MAELPTDEVDAVRFIVKTVLNQKKEGDMYHQIKKLLIVFIVGLNTILILYPWPAFARISLSDIQQQINDLTTRVEALEAGGVPGPEPEQNIIVVALDGSGAYTSPVQAMAAITDASSTKPYTIKIRPGVYDIGTSTLKMKSYVTVEGSGQQNTTIKGKVNGMWTAGLVSAASTYNTEIRSLTVVNSDVTDSTAISVSNGSLVVSDVTATATSVRFANGILCKDSTLTLSDVTAQGTNTDQTSEAHGIYNYTCSVTMTNIVAIGTSKGIDNFLGCDVTMTKVTATATNGSAAVSNNQCIVVMNDVTATASWDRYTVAGVQNFSTPSVSMINVTASASGQPGAQSAYGVWNRDTGSNPTSVSMTNVTATASGADSQNSGVANHGPSTTVTMTDVTSTASGGSSAFGVQNFGASSVEMTRITASAVNASFAVGIWGRQSNVNISNSVVSGTSYSLYAESFVHYVTNTKLQGRALFSSSLICTGVTDLSGNPLDGNCQ
jgi:hypothetical protein